MSAPVDPVRNSQAAPHEHAADNVGQFKLWKVVNALRLGVCEFETHTGYKL
jgi:hypothetical protein